MYNVSPDVTMLQLNLSNWCKSKYGDRFEKQTMLPRLLWVRKDMSMKDLHFFIFKSIRQVLSQWAMYADPNSTIKKEKENLRSIIEFPFNGADSKPLTQQ